MTTHFYIQGEVNGVWQVAHGGGGLGGMRAVSSPSINFGQEDVGEPVNPANGDVTHEETDFSIPNLGTPLEMVRSYDSFNTVASGTAWSDRGMGDGWSFSCSDEITLARNLQDPADAGDALGTLVWFTDSGLILKFLPNGSGGYTTPPTIFGNLTTWTVGTATGYLWTDKTGAVTIFTNYTVSGVTTAYVTQISDRYNNGAASNPLYYNGVSIARDATTADITTVSDLSDPSRCLTFV